MKAKKITYQIIVITLMTLWIPISLDKFIDYELFKSAMIQQPFSDRLGILLAHTLPTMELTVGLLFIVPKMRVWAFGLSALLMVVFVAYVSLAILNVWGKIPCGCGLVFHHVGWTAHLWLNIGFLLISLIGLYLELSVFRNYGSKNSHNSHSGGHHPLRIAINLEDQHIMKLKTSARLKKE